MDDILDSSLNLEDTHLKEGYAEGYEAVLIAGKQEAKQVSFQAGEEIGSYTACVDVWNSVTRLEPDRLSTRVRKGVSQIGELVHKYPLEDPEDEPVQELMEALRLKFRAICATLGVESASGGHEIGF